MSYMIMLTSLMLYLLVVKIESGVVQVGGYSRGTQIGSNLILSEIASVFQTRFLCQPARLTSVALISSLSNPLNHNHKGHLCLKKLLLQLISYDTYSQRFIRCRSFRSSALTSSTILRSSATLMSLRLPSSAWNNSRKVSHPTLRARSEDSISEQPC